MLIDERFPDGPADSASSHLFPSHLSVPRLAGPWDLCPSSGRWLNQKDSFSLSTQNVLGTLILVLHINVGDATMLSKHPQCPGELAMRLLEYERSSWFCRILSALQRTEENLLHAARQENRHGKDEFLQTVRVLQTQFRLFGTFMLHNINEGGSALLIRKNLLPDDAVVSHVTTCQGCDHVVTIRSGESVLVIINVHFETDLTLRNLRERQRRIASHWPRYLEGLGVIVGDLNICKTRGRKIQREESSFHRR